jgi:hypothetical protein
MHEDDFSVPGKNNVWATGKVLAMKPKAVAEPMQDRTNNKFWPGILAADATHE